MRGRIDGVNNDYIQGWALDDDDPTRRVLLDVFYNGELLTTTAAGFPRPDLLQAQVGDGANGFFVAMPALQHPEDAEIRVALAGTDEALGEPHNIRRLPLCSPAGLVANDVLDLHSTPLHSMQGIAFDGQKLLVYGIHLPPEGNPFNLSLRAAPGIEYTFHYPLHSPEVGAWYWYWPNGHWSTFRIEIDVSASTDVGPHFDLWFENAAGDDDYNAMDRNHLRIPKDLSAYQNYPGGDNLTRVQHFDNIRRVALAGYNDYRQVATLAESYGADLASSAVLDWGSGHGRVIRHFADHGRVKEAWAVDIDPENIAWLNDNIDAVQASTVPLLPPTDLPEKHFDVVYAISVMTHLTHDVQEAWLTELKRITKPGGLVMLTFAGRTSAAFSSRFLKPEWLESWRVSGFDATLDSLDLNGKIGDDEYYRNTKQTPEYTSDFWGKYFEILAIHETMFGYQDIAIMRA